ncbi:uncharacterized protein [Thunnus thynnus]|uniref:uncharacterized protein n=1 Tax=Thunnus thynnus TaxID=8237 RepID=UPI00352711BB
MDFSPVFPTQPSSAELTLQPSPYASRLAQAYHRQRSAVAYQVKMPERVREEAKARVLQAGGDPECWQLVLSESELQFGQYRGQTFKWLLSHDVGYTCAILVSHQKEREGGNTSQSPLSANKDALTSYAQLFPQMTGAIQQRRMREGTLSVRGMDQTLVGFGARARETYQSPYESTSSESQTYVQWLRKQKVKVGSRMHTLQAYMLGRDMAAQQTALQPPSSAAASADPSEPLDDVLLAAAMEVDSQLVRDAPPAVSPPGPSLPPAVPLAGDGPGQPANLASTSGAELLPMSWRLTLPEEQQDWLGWALFTRGAGGQLVLTSELRR